MGWGLTGKEQEADSWEDGNILYEGGCVHSMSPWTYQAGMLRYVCSLYLNASRTKNKNQVVRGSGKKSIASV